ncbi:Tether containing UBX domain for GLUT4 [Lunasporangiospora selenospora]|uniref:Tether containing UBX domain for GLUT4 n=1 Tax=Lunasporangiospora selenospora TaxID=979761 RepID=A0A9P6FV83_9FUNG|nr:Tether containing UBX domain for GLUT4 [Lunasporangiospora selenospora]
MASNLTVFLGGGKKQIVKTSPVMILRQVVNTVCEKQNYPEPETFGLKSGKTFLDLSLSIRYANIAPGAKLELAKVPKDKSAPTHVDLALQLEDGGRVIRSFPISSTLWDVLLGFEQASNGTLNLTRRTAVPQTTTKNIFLLQRIKKAVKPTEVYLLPIVILLEREYVSITTLKTTTLQLAGLLRGNAVFRVLMRYTDAGIEDFREEIERDYSRETATINAQNSPASSSSSSAPEPTTPAFNTTTVHSGQVLTDKTAGEKDFILSRDAYHGGASSDLVNPQGVPVPGMTSRTGSIDPDSREGNMAAPIPSGGIDLNLQRNTPVQDMNTAMIEANQEIRQLREQETQAALTDRVKRLSKASDSSDRERFVRSLPPGAFTEEPVSEMDVDTPQPRSESPNAALPSQQDLVRQIAHRVSQQLRNAQKRGDSTMDYYALIAQEVEKEQKAGALPPSPAGSRHNSIYKSKDEDVGSPRLVTAPGSLPASGSAETAVKETVERNVKVFRPPTDNSTPLSNQIELPDDFYTLTPGEAMKLWNSQKKQREEEESRGFKTAQTRAEEEKARERRYPRTIIRIRFPDRVQLQATFQSQETVGDVRRWVASACVGHGEKFDLYTTPPKKILSDDKQTLYQAGLAPQSIVYFSWVDSKLNSHSPFLNGEHMMMMQDLPLPGQETESEDKKAEVDSTRRTEGTSSTGRGYTLEKKDSIHLMTKEDRRMSAKMSSDKPGTAGGSSSGGGLPKWMKLSKK